MGVWYIMSTTLTAAKAEVNRIEASIKDHEKTAPVLPIMAATKSPEKEDYLTKDTEYRSILAGLQTQLGNAKLEVTLAEWALKPPEHHYHKGPKGGKKSRKSHNSKKYKKSKKSHTTYKKSKRSRR